MNSENWQRLVARSPSPIERQRQNATLGPRSITTISFGLAGVRRAFNQYRSSRERGAVYDYLQAVFDPVSAWKAQGNTAVECRRALIRATRNPQLPSELFAAVIFCSSDPVRVDDRTRSKWSRALQYAASAKTDRETLKAFMTAAGGVNQCAAKLRQTKTSKP